MGRVHFTESDVGKDVVSSTGERVGIVSSVIAGTARVDPDPGITPITTRLGREDESNWTYPLQESTVATVTDDEVLLRTDL